MRNIRQNLFFAVVYNGVGIPVAAGALYPFFGLRLSPIIAAAAMAASSLSVVTNANRLRRWAPRPLPAEQPAAVEPEVEVGGEQEPAAHASATDPVCGMAEVGAGAITALDADGQTQYFCSQGCRDAYKPLRMTG